MVKDRLTVWEVRMERRVYVQIIKEQNCLIGGGIAFEERRTMVRNGNRYSLVSLVAKSLCSSELT